MKLGPYELDQIYTGDARELAKAIPDESIDLIFTDPVYDRIDDYRWLAETAARVLKHNSAALMYHATINLPNVLCVMIEGGLQYRWQIAGIMPSLNSWAIPPMFNGWRSLLLMGKGIPKCFKYVKDYDNDTMKTSLPQPANHKWTKNPDIISKWIGAFTKSSAIVFDPFTGGGTVPAVCKMLGRHYLAFEIDPDIAERARQRIQNTQPPLFVPQPEQLELEAMA